MGFVMVWIVQFTAFMMTLRRKNVFSHTTWVLIYATILGSGFAVSEYDTFVICGAWHITAIANLMVYMRLNCYCNKYMMWAFCAVIMVLYRSGVVRTSNPNTWAYLCVASLAAIAGAAHSKVSAANAKAARQKLEKKEEEVQEEEVQEKWCKEEKKAQLNAKAVNAKAVDAKAGA